MAQQIMQTVNGLGNSTAVQSFERCVGLRHQLLPRQGPLIRLLIVRVEIFEQEPHLGLQVGTLVPAPEHHGRDGCRVLDPTRDAVEEAVPRVEPEERERLVRTLLCVVGVILRRNARLRHGQELLVRKITAVFLDLISQ